MGKMINHIGFDFVALRILHIRIRAQIEPPVQYQAGCVENSKSIQGIFRCGRIDLFTKCFGDEKPHMRLPPMSSPEPALFVPH